MADYIKVKTVDAHEVNRYLEEGWELMGSTLSYGKDPSLKYDIGLTAKALADHLAAIIRDYERFGLKEKLFEEIAKEHGDHPDNYQTDGTAPVENELTKYMQDYELYVNDRIVVYSKKK